MYWLGEMATPLPAGALPLWAKTYLIWKVEERAAAGLFLGFQHPVPIPGLSNLQFLRSALNAQRVARGEEELNGADFMRLAKEKSQTC